MTDDSVPSISLIGASGHDKEVIRNHAAFIWSVADLLRGDYKQSEYGKVILPLTVIRRMDCVLESTKGAVLDRFKKVQGKIDNLDPILESVAKQQFFNTSPLDFQKLLSDPVNIADNLRSYISAFSPAAKDVVDKFSFGVEIDHLDRANLLYKVIGEFANLDLHPDAVNNLEMGYLYEELIRRFSELSNETAGEHFTPREVIRLMVNLLFIEDEDVLTKPGTVRTLCDPACGTGGMLSVAEDHLRALNPQARLEVFGEEVNEETYAVCRSDMMIKGQDASHIVCGNSFTEDGHDGRTFDYLLANPPFGVEWKKVEDAIRTEADTKGFAGRFGAGLPRINDGSFLFLQHMISKMKPVSEGGSRLAIVFNGSPLFTGAAGSGESEIRRWIIENDWLEAVVALPDQLFYNTGISIYFWVITNRKPPERRGKVQLVDARDYWVKLRKNLGQKRKELSAEQIHEITRLYGEFTDGPSVRVLPNEAFGFMRITVEQPLRLRWDLNDHTIAAALSHAAVAKLDDGAVSAIKGVLWSLLGKTWITEKAATTAIASKLTNLGLGDSAIKAIIARIAVHDDDALPVTDRKGNPEADPNLRDNENVPLHTAPLHYEFDTSRRLEHHDYRSTIDDYVHLDVLPYLPEAWVDYAKTRIGYAIPISQQFFKYAAPRALQEIDAEIEFLEGEIQGLLSTKPIR